MAGPATWIGPGLGAALLLVGVVSGAVTVEAMLFAAWLENLAIGGATTVALLRAPGGQLALPANVQVTGIAVRTAPDGTRTVPAGCAAGFFVAHFGLFTFVHGVFLAVAVVFAHLGFPGAAEAPGVGLNGVGVLVVLVAAVVRAMRRVEPRRAIVQAYAGLLPVHVAVLLLFTTVVDPSEVGPGRAAALAIVGLLVLGDLIRARIAARPTPQPPPPQGPPLPPPRPSA